MSISELRPAQRRREHGCSPNFPSVARPISFLHPAYPRHQNVLFHMFALDGRDGGLHYTTAHTACAIVAGNRWDGFLSHTKTGPPIDAEGEDLLTGQEYYFIVPGPLSSPDTVIPLSPPQTLNHTSTPTPAPIPSITPSTITPPYLYPIVPSFRQWRFPHSNLPDAWDWIETRDTGAGRSNSDAVIARDVTCRMTDYVEECDTAHLCPKTEPEWFQDNRMDRYTTELRRSGRTAIDNKANVMLLRADLHRAYDKMRFVHVPKRDAQGELRFVTHLIHHSIELGQLYHNTELHTLGVAKEFLFTRLAYDVFPLLAGFLQQKAARYLLEASTDDPVWASPDQGYHHSEEWKPANQRSSRTPSPTKRSRVDAGIEETPSGGDAYRSPAKRARYEGPLDTHALDPPADQWPSSDRTEQADPVPSKINIDHPPKDNALNLMMPDSSQSQSSTSDPDESRVVSREDSVAGMYDLYLRKERARSDPHSHWDREQRWLRGIFDRGGALDASELKRYAIAMGYDVVDEVEVE